MYMYLIKPSMLGLRIGLLFIEQFQDTLHEAATVVTITALLPPTHPCGQCRTFLTLPEVQGRQARQRRKLEAAASWERRKIYGKVNVVAVGM